MNLKKLSVLLLALTILPQLTFAEIEVAGEAVAEVANASAQAGEEISFLGFVMMGGVILIPIFTLLFYAIYVMIERARYIKKTTKYDANLLENIKADLMKGDISSALDKAERDPSSFGAVFAEGIKSIDRPTLEIEKNMEKIVNIEIAKMEKGGEALGIIAGIAPTLGFVGTIVGVIKIFYNISISENVSISTISGGLYEKMISSGAGLLVGLIAYAAYHILNTVIDRYALKVGIISSDFINLIRRPVK